MGRRDQVAALIALLGALAPGLARAEAVACRDDTVLVRTGETRARFTVEIADDAAERAQGLMGREHLPASAGMLFVYPEAGPRAFWMHDTPLPLDIIFIGAQGRVVSIAANATPFDDTPLPSAGPAQFVLEINGGLAAKLGIGPGAEIAHPAIARDRAAWPCD